MTIKNRKEISSEITKLELEKELLVKEKSVLRKKIGDKKRKISALRKQLKKAEKMRYVGKARQKLRNEKEKEKEKRPILSLSVLLFLPVISATLLLSVIYANAIFPFETLDFLATYYPLVIPFIIFSISLICLIASIFYFALYQLIQNYRKAK